ncbi:MAG TPA: hypothetical protein VML92_08625 [Steroidobacteraceae bacterium]|nr:hypothetical protein [Steroidobacteraceae bacterium]
MNIHEERLEGRLRGLFGPLDARAGFEERVMARVASLAAQRGAVRTDLGAQFERRRELTRRRLLREAWSNGITIAGIGVAAGALAWHYADLIGRWLVEPVASGRVDPLLAAGVSLTAVAAVVVMVIWRPSRLLR